MSALYDYGERKKQEGIKEGRKKGRKEGIKEGMKEGMKEGIIEGIIEGIKEGRKEGLKEYSKKMALYMIKKGENDEEIQKETELSPDEIKTLRKKTGK